MPMHRMIRLAVFSTYLCAASSAQTLGLERTTEERRASAWDGRLHELISSRHPEMWSATSSDEFLVRVLTPWRR